MEKKVEVIEKSEDAMEDAELQRLSEDLQQVLGMLKYRGRRRSV